MHSAYVTIYEEYKHKFFQMPKVLFTSNKYKGLSNDAKLAWSLLRERSSISKKNRWFDRDTGRVFFIYKNEDLMEMLNIKSRATISKIKKELLSVGLIEEERLGFNQPNKIYLKYPNVEEQDIEKIDEFEGYSFKMDKNDETAVTLGGQGCSKNEHPKETAVTLGAQGCLKFEHPDVQKLNPSYTEYSYILDTTDTIDTEDTETDEISSSPFSNSYTQEKREKEKQKYMDNAFYADNDHVPERIAKMLNVFSATTEQASEYYKIILQAKKRVEEKEGQVIWLEHHPDLEQGIINAFSRAVRKIEKEGNVENESGYIYQSIYGYLSKELHNRVTTDDVTADNSNVLFYDWLKDG